jgi:SAM-dependent methyltransferase
MKRIDQKTVLNVGCGPKRENALHAAFRGGGWREVRLDVDPGTAPDILADVVDMGAAVADGSFDAVWSSHNVEHLFAHEAPRAFAEFRRVLRSDGFALVTCPDLGAIARMIVAGRFGETIYQSPAGPIGLVDMLFGHSKSIESGCERMAHRTGFTAEALGQGLVEAGFAEVWVAHGARYDLWAAALAEEARAGEVRQCLARGGLDLRAMARQAA